MKRGDIGWADRVVLNEGVATEGSGRNGRNWDMLFFSLCFSLEMMRSDFLITRMGGSMILQSFCNRNFL